MKIKRKDLLKWIEEGSTIRVNRKLYKTYYNGRYYFLKEVMGEDTIKFYDKGRGVFGLEISEK